MLRDTWKPALCSFGGAVPQVFVADIPRLTMQEPAQTEFPKWLPLSHHRDCLGNAHTEWLLQVVAPIAPKPVPTQPFREERDQVRRFITLIDTLYETHTKLVCTAELDPIPLLLG